MITRTLLASLIATSVVTTAAIGENRHFDDASSTVDIITTRNIRAGEVIRRADLTVDGDKATPGSKLELLVGTEAKRTLYAGARITENDVGPKTLITRNAIVLLEFARGPLLITTEGRALDSGAAGEVIRVMNLNSKIILSAVVIDQKKARTR